jgi:predicted RND superfamily exporter protein
MSKLLVQLDDVIDLVDDDKKSELEDLRAVLAVPKLTDLKGASPQLLAKFLGHPNSAGQVVYIYQSGSLMDLRMAARFAKAVGDLKVGDHQYRAISEPLIYVDMLELLKRDCPLALLLAGLALFVVLLADFRSLSRVVIVVIPLASGLLVMAACMALVPIHLNLLNAVVLPSILGRGVDGGVHMYHALLEQGRGQLGLVMRTTGAAVAACTVTSMLGFAGLLVADHPGLRSIGLLALCGLAGCLFGAIVVLPSTVASWPRSMS